MAVYDCCMFLNENDLYELRLNQHWDFVDKFIVLEAGETHTGLKKPFNFDKKRFEKYSEKLIYKTFNSFEEEIPKNTNLLDQFTVHDRSAQGQVTDDWIRDHFQGNYLFKILLEEGARDDDLILISCLDEIISECGFKEAMKLFEDKDKKYTLLNGSNQPLFITNPEVTTSGDEWFPKKEFKIRPVFGFTLDFYVYKFNLYHNTLCAAMMTELSALKIFLPTTLRSMSLHTHDCIEKAGWHFTFLDDTDGEKVLEKQRSWAHSRDQRPNEKVKFYNTTKEEALEKLFQDYKLDKVKISETSHPRYLIENLDKFKNYIYEE